MSDRSSRQERRYEQYGEADFSWDRPPWVDAWSSAEAPSQAVRRPRRRARRRGRARRWWIILGILVALAALVLGGLYALEWRFQGRILPHVYVASVDVGNMTPEEAEATLRLHYEAFEQQPLTLVYEDQVWRPSGEEIGLRIAWQEAVSEAMAVGRGGSFQDRWQQRWHTWTTRHDLLLPATLDDAVLRGYLERLALAIDVLPLDASLAVEGRHVYVRPGHEGRSLQTVLTVLEIKNTLTQILSEPVVLTVVTVPPEIDEAAVQGAIATAQRMLAGPLVLHVDELSWTLTPEHIGEMLMIERRQELGHDILMVVLNQNALRSFVSGIAAEVQVYPRNAHFRFVEGQLQVTDEGASGRELSVEVAMDRINEAVLSTDREIELTVVEVLPDIRRETLAELGIQELVAVGESTFAGSRPYRAHNIVTAARILDGTLIAPGEEFSFIENIGPIDESDGFVQGYSIVSGRTVLNVGGGVCQVSTTTFRAAFFAGLPILERHAHSFRIGYYEWGSVLGLDATIFSATGTDLRFRNDTEGYLLMQLEAYTDTGMLYVYLYGTKPDREVVMEGPYLSNWTPAPTDPVYVYNPELPEGYTRQTDWAQGGVDAVIYRKILIDGEVVRTDTFFSRYEAWPNVFEVGTGSP